MSEKQQVLFGRNFLESYAGRLLRDPKSALIELIANTWDAGSTDVRVSWPDGNKLASIVVEDNGHGMTEGQFLERWRTLSYDRQRGQGCYAEFPKGVVLPRRRAFGQNGVGRFAAFCFGSMYEVLTSKDGSACHYEVSKGETLPFALKRLPPKAAISVGTTVSIPNPNLYSLRAEDISNEIGMRFLSDPNFKVHVNGELITLSGIPKDNYQEIPLEVKGVGAVKLVVLDTRATDRTAKQHGIAWWVGGRLVGECSWKTFSDQSFIDQRFSVARRYTFIVVADGLVDHVTKDWSGFRDGSDEVSNTVEVVDEAIKQVLLASGASDRAKVFKSVRDENREAIRKLGHRGKDKWCTFVSEAQKNCPRIPEADLSKLAGILAKLEASHSKYGLIQKLHELDSDQLDSLHEIMATWSVDVAKEVLDELEGRLSLLDELKKRVDDPTVDEVHELQPIFEQGLWIFGPEYETIEFTSNQGMTRVIQDLFGSDAKGSRNRPDFVLLTDSSISLFSYPSYDEQGAEVGVAKVVILELKKPGIRIGTDEKGQCWKYVKELYEKGQIGPSTTVTCFVMGTEIDQTELQATTHKEGAVKVLPLLYSTVVDRAHSRLFNLHRKVASAPFLNKSGIDGLIDEVLQERVGLSPDYSDGILPLSEVFAQGK